MTPGGAGFFRAEADGVSIRLRIQPKARVAGFRGVGESADGPRLRLAVSAPATDGAANRAVILALAAALDLAPNALTLVRGAGGREKTVHAAGDPAGLAEALLRLGSAA